MPEFKFKKMEIKDLKDLIEFLEKKQKEGAIIKIDLEMNNEVKQPPARLCDPSEWQEWKVTSSEINIQIKIKY